MRLTQVNQQLEKSAFELSDREFQYLLSRENSHRINVGFEGTWILMGIRIILLSHQSPRYTIFQVDRDSGNSILNTF